MSIKSQLANVKARLEILQISQTAAYEKRVAMTNLVDHHTRQIALLQELYRKQEREKEKGKPVESEPPACPACGTVMTVSIATGGIWWICRCVQERCIFWHCGKYEKTHDIATKAAYEVIERMRKNLNATAND